jgi:hypothetical protein
MAFDLIQQQNILKGLTDEHLQQEMARPNGETPPFLVLTELNRRKQMRSSYNGERMRRGLNPTTVADDLLKSPIFGPKAGGGLGDVGAPSAAMPPPSPMPTGGLDAAAGGMPGFASGGIVGGDGYASLQDRYAAQLADVDKQKEREQALALLAAGAGMMSAKTSNFGTALGEGIHAGVTAYQAGLENVSANERAALAGLTDVTSMQHQDELAALQRAREDQRNSVADDHWKQNFDADQAQNEIANQPATIREFKARQAMSPDDQAQFDLINGKDKATVAADKIFQQTYSGLLAQDKGSMDAMARTPEEQAARTDELYKQAAILTYQRIKSAYGGDAADRYAANAGLSDADVVGGISTTPSTGTDSGVTDWTTYFGGN